MQVNVKQQDGSTAAYFGVWHIDITEDTGEANDTSGIEIHCFDGFSFCVSGDVSLVTATDKEDTTKLEFEEHIALEAAEPDTEVILLNKPDSLAVQAAERLISDDSFDYNDSVTIQTEQ